MAVDNNSRLMQEIQDQFLLCKICYDSYTKPKTLGCLHVFCEDCLEHHMEAEMQRSNRYLLYKRNITCPVCRKQTDLPTGGVRKLPDNFLVENITRVLTRRKHATNLPMCGICLPTAMLNRESREAVCKCLDCFKLLCRSCVQLHRRTKVTKSHSLIDIEDMKDIECKEHPNEMVRFYCEPCDMCICVVCTFQEHKGHEVSSFVDGIHKYKSSMDGIMNVCQDRVALLQSRLELIDRCETAIRQAEERIRDTAMESIGSIRKREKQMLDDLRVAYGEETMEYIEQKSSIQEALDNLMSACSMTDIMLKDKGVELLLLKKDIQDKLEVLVDVEEIPPPENISKQIKFRPGSMVFGSLNFVQPKKESGEEELIPIRLNNGCSMVDSFEISKPLDGSSDINDFNGFHPLLVSDGKPLHSFFSDVSYVDAGTSPINFSGKNDGLVNGDYISCDSMDYEIYGSLKDNSTSMSQIDFNDMFTNTPYIEHCDRSTLTKKKKVPTATLR